MNKTLNFLSLILIFSFFSCSRFINLGDSETKSYNEDGLPEELADSESKSAGDEDYYGEESDMGDAGDTVDTGGDTGNSGNTGNTGDSGNSGNSSYDNEVSDDDGYYNGGYPFSDDFSNDTCSCGEDPVYDPVCCTGNISVFNACFANCYANNSQGAICSEYVQGVCKSVIQPVSDDDSTDEDADDEDFSSDIDSANDKDFTDDSYTDEDVSDAPDWEQTDVDTLSEPDESLNDEDIFTPVDNECGCYPEDTTFNCCYVNGTVLISSCMAQCHCEGGYSNCF